MHQSASVTGRWVREAFFITMSNGWIKLHRKILEHWIWEDSAKLKMWLDLLLMVNHDDQKINIGMSIVECKRGQTVMSLQSLATRWRVTKSLARRFLDLLEKDSMIARENLQKTTRITICNYDTYNDSRNANETLMKRKRNADETLAYPNKNEKNDKNEKEIKKYDFVAVGFEEIFKTWGDYKISIGDRIKSDRAAQAAYNRLNELAGGRPEIAKKIVEQSMGNGWKGLFELKTINGNGQYAGQGLPRRYTECGFANPDAR